jgi:hypothetical protein
LRALAVGFTFLIACGRPGLLVPGDPTQPIAQSTSYCGGAPRDGALVAWSRAQVGLLESGTLTTIATFTDGTETQVVAAGDRIAVEHGTLALYDRTGALVWQAAGRADDSLFGILGDGTVILDRQADQTTRRIGPSRDEVIATHGHPRWVDDTWVLVQFDTAAGGNSPAPGPRYEWHRPASGEAVPVPPGWIFIGDGMFHLGPTVGLFSPGSAEPMASIALSDGSSSIDGAFSDGGADLIFDAYDPTTSARQGFVWQVARDLSRATKLDIGRNVETPTMDAAGALFTLLTTSGGLQPSRTFDAAAPFVAMGTPVDGEFGGVVAVDGTTAAFNIAEGHTWSEPPNVQVFYDHATTPQVFGGAAHKLTSFALSPDGQCAAYFDLSAGNGELVLRELRLGVDTHLGGPFVDPLTDLLRIAWN